MQKTKNFHGLLLGISVLPALMVMPAMAEPATMIWEHPDVESYTTIDRGIDFAVKDGTYNTITGTAMRNIVNGDVNLTVNNVIQESFNKIIDGVHGVLFTGNEVASLDSGKFKANIKTFTGSELTEEEQKLQAYVNGDINVKVSNSTIQNNVIGVNFVSSYDDITTDGALSGKTTVTVDNSEVGLGVRGVNYSSATKNIPNAKIGDLELNIKDSLIKEEVVSAGSHASAGNVVINVTGDSVIGYTTRDADKKSDGDGWIIAGANRTGATIDSTVVNLDTAGTIKIAGDVHTGSRERTDKNNSDKDSVRGTATLNMLGGGNIEIGGDVRAYHVKGATTLNMSNIDATVGGTVKEFQTINMDENSKLTAKELIMTEEDVVNLVLASKDNYSQITVDTLDAKGAALKMLVKNAGTYNVVSAENEVSDFTWDLDNSIFNLSEEDGTVTAIAKSVEDIAGDNDLSAAASQTVANLVNSSSDKLNNFGLLVQESLANKDADAVEKAHKAINPEETSAVQSVASHVQGTVAKLAANRMSVPSVGRNGGDIDMTAGGVWAQGLFNKSKLNGEFHGYTRGVAAGIDGTINRVFTIGAGYAFNHSDLSLNSRDTEIDSNTVFVYGQYKPSAWYANATLNYTMSDYTEKGSALGVAIDSDYKVNSFGGQVMTGYDFANGLTPEVGVRYMHIKGDKYTNSLGIQNKIDDADYLTAILGGKYAESFAISDDLALKPEVRLAAKYDLMSDDAVTTVAMPGVTAYSVKGDRLNRFGGEAGLGITMSYKTVDLSLSYDIEVRKDYTSQTGMLKARYNF